MMNCRAAKDHVAETELVAQPEALVLLAHRENQESQGQRGRMDHQEMWASQGTPERLVNL